MSDNCVVCGANLDSIEACENGHFCKVENNNMCNCESSFCGHHKDAPCTLPTIGDWTMDNVGVVCGMCVHYIVMNGGSQYIHEVKYGPTPVSFEESGMMVRVGSEVMWRGWTEDDFEFVTVTKVMPDSYGFPWVGTVEVRSANGIRSICSSMDLSPVEAQDFDFATQATFAGFDFEQDDEEIE